MSELTAIYNYLESNIAKEAISSSIEEFFENLTAAGFDVETALAEAAKLDNRLGGLGSIKNINEYAQSKKSSNIDKLVDSINIDYPGSLQEVLNYCLLNNEDLSAVAGGVGGNTRIIKNFSTNSNIVKDDVKVELRDFANVAETYVEDYAYNRENPIENNNAGDKNSANAPGYDASGNITRGSEIKTFIDGPSGVNNNDTNALGNEVAIEVKDLAEEAEKEAETDVEDYAYNRENPIEYNNAGDKNSTNAPGYDASGNITRESEISTFIDGPSGVNSNE